MPSAAGSRFAACCTLALAVGALILASEQPAPARAGDVRLTISVALTSGARVPGAGRVAAASPKIACSDTCAYDVPAGTTVELTAEAAAGYVFDHWADPGRCEEADPGSQRCTIVTTGESDAVTAIFVAQTRVLRVVAGGAGSVSSGGNGIACGSLSDSACAAEFLTGAEVTLTATPAPGARLVKWSVWECARVRPTCTINLVRDRTVEAVFDRASVTVRRIGTGGAISSDPPGIACGVGCDTASATYPRGTVVTLRAEPGVNAPFRRWGVPCAGPLATCRITVARNELIEAAFGFKAPGSPLPSNVASGPPASAVAGGEEIYVDMLGRGKGIVTISAPAPALPGVHCHSRCLAAGYQYNRVITLRALPAKGSRFAGWINGCVKRRRSCAVHVAGHNAIAARFAVAR